MIRKSQPSDLDKIMEIWLLATLEAHDFIPASYWWQHQEMLRTNYLEQAEMWVDEEDDGIIGFFALNKNTLTALFVRPDHQRQKVGEKLLAKAKTLRNKLKLYVYAENSGALRFYLRHHFHIHKQQIEPTTQREELVMEYDAVTPSIMTDRRAATTSAA